jgi:hypothetical protein
MNSESPPSSAQGVPPRPESLSRKQVCSGRWPGVWTVDVDRGAGRPHQAPVAGDVVGVGVGLQHVADPHPVQPRQPQVGLDVPLRVDDHRHPRFAVGDQVGGAAEVLVDYLAEEHGRKRVFE